MSDPAKVRLATHADWVAHRQIITDLYAEVELDELMRVMESNHGFYSTSKVYKTKIKEWNVGKRLNDDDMLAILQLKSQRSAAGKDTQFFLMGKPVNELNIRRYVKRKPQLVTRFRRGHRAPETRGRIACVTPPPVPGPIGRVPEPNSDIEMLLHDCKTFWRSSIDLGHWVLDPNGVCIGLRSGRLGSEMADGMMAKFWAAADLLQNSDFSGAFQVLDLGFRESGRLLKLDVPKLFPALVVTLARLEQFGQRDALNIFRKYIQGQGAALEHGNPAFRVLLQRTSALDVERYHDVFPRLLDLMLAQSDDLFGAGSCLSLDVYYLRFAGYVVREDSAGQARSLKAVLDTIPADAPRGPWVARHERLYAWKHAQVLRDQGRYDEALAELRVLEGTFRLPDETNDLSRHWHFVAVVYRHRGDLPMTEKYFRLALKVSMTRKGGADEDSLQFGSRRLAEVLELMGRHEEAARVLDYVQDQIQSIASQVDWDWDEFQRRTAAEPARFLSPGGSTTVVASEEGALED